MCFADILFLSVAYLFILLTVSFAEYKFCILIKSNLPIIFFMDHAFGVASKKSSLNPRSPRFSPILSSRSFIVLHSPFRAVIHFELIFVKDVMSVSRFIFWHLDVLLFQHHLLKRLSLYH